MPITAIISGLCAIAPTIANWLGGEKAEQVTSHVVGLAKTITGVSDEHAALVALQNNPEMALAFEKACQAYVLEMEKERTTRHKTDMASDSWLSKNIRPMVLIYLMAAWTAFAVVSIKWKIAPAYTEMLKDMLLAAFGFYFLSRGVEKVASLIKGK